MVIAGRGDSDRDLREEGEGESDLGFFLRFCCFEVELEPGFISEGAGVTGSRQFAGFVFAVEMAEDFDGRWDWLCGDAWDGGVEEEGLSAVSGGGFGEVV